MSHDYEIEQKESDRIGGIYSIVTNTIIFLVLFFVKAWDFQTIQPPVDGGIELNFGTDAKGSGNIQTYNKASDLKDAFDSKASDDRKTKKELAKATPQKVIVPPPVAEKRVKSPVKEVPLRTQTKESPYKIEDKKVADKPKAVTPATKPVVAEQTPTKAQTTPQKPEPVEPTPPVAKPNPNGLFSKGGGKNTTSNGTKDGQDDRPGGNNNGDKPGSVGDQGDPKGSIDAKGLYGKGGKGGGTGASINISGWTWKSKPNVNDDSDDTGRIVFQVKVDSDGNVLSVRTIESGVSPSVLEKYKRAVQSLDLRPSSDGDAPPVSTGTITFILKAK